MITEVQNFFKRQFDKPVHKKSVGEATTNADKARLAVELGRMVAENKTSFCGQIIASEELMHSLAVKGKKVRMGVFKSLAGKPVGGYCRLPNDIAPEESYLANLAPFMRKVRCSETGQVWWLGSDVDIRNAKEVAKKIDEKTLTQLKEELFGIPVDKL